MKTLPIVWRRLRRGWGSLWQGGYLLLFREFGKHQCDAGSLACGLVQATLGVCGAGVASTCVATLQSGTGVLLLALKGSLSLSIIITTIEGCWAALTQSDASALRFSVDLSASQLPTLYFKEGVMLSMELHVLVHTIGLIHTACCM